jgi:glycerol transport system ATP-binding protein
MARIEFKKLAHSYVERPQSPADYALKEMDFAWEDGGAYALLGPSGCGKTTLLNIISGLLQPSQGRVLYDGRDVTALSPAKRNIAQVFQFPVIYDTMTVAENLAFPLRNRHVPRGDVQRRVTELLDMLELQPVANRRASGLTADQKQKISMGRGLVRDDVAAILFDEPLTVIDPHLKWQLRRKLKEVHERFGHTLVYVTHDQNEALTFADKVVVMYDGEVVQLGTPQDLFEAPAHRYVGYFIGSPGMNFMGAHLVSDGIGIDGTAIVLSGHWAEAGRRHAKSRLAIGIRPEFMGISATPRDDAVPAQLLSVQDLGNFRLVRAQLGPHEVMAKLPEDQAVPTDRVHLVFQPEWTKLYADDRLVA